MQDGQRNNWGRKYFGILHNFSLRILKHYGKIVLDGGRESALGSERVDRMDEKSCTIQTALDRGANFP